MLYRPRPFFPSFIMIILVSSDDVLFEADREVVECSSVIRQMLEALGEQDQEIPLPNVSSDVLEKVLEYCEYYRGDQYNSRKRTTAISGWDQKFITVDQEMLFAIILAANFLDIKSLL